MLPQISAQLMHARLDVHTLAMLGIAHVLGIEGRRASPSADVEESASQSGGNREAALSCISHVTSPFFFSPLLQRSHVRIEKIY